MYSFHTDNAIVKKNYILRAGRVAQVVQCLPNKYEALSSNPSTIKKKIIFEVEDIAQW
jgi:hypothetical protein